MAMSAEQKRAQRAARKAELEADASAARAAGVKTPVEIINEAAMKRPDLVTTQSLITPSRSGAKVTVGCKLGVAYFDIQLSRKERIFEQNMQGGREVDVYARFGPTVRLRGTAYPRGTVPDGFPDKPKIVGGAAMNPGVDKEFWDAWVEQHKLDPLVINGFIFANENDDFVTGQARETVEVTSGLDPLKPDDKTDKRIPRSTRTDLADIETEEARAKKMARR